MCTTWLCSCSRERESLRRVTRFREVERSYVCRTTFVAPPGGKSFASNVLPEDRKQASQQRRSESKCRTTTKTILRRIQYRGWGLEERMTERSYPFSLSPTPLSPDLSCQTAPFSLMASGISRGRQGLLSELEFFIKGTDDLRPRKDPRNSLEASSVIPGHAQFRQIH